MAKTKTKTKKPTSAKIRKRDLTSGQKIVPRPTSQTPNTSPQQAPPSHAHPASSSRSASLRADSKDALIAAAKKVFAEKSFDGATVKDLADAAGVNVSLVSYYFNGKEGLYRTCLETFGHEQLASAERVLRGAESQADFTLRLKVFAEEFITLHLREPDVCKILHRDCDEQNEIVMDIFKTSFIPLYYRLKDYFEFAAKRHLLEKGCDTDTVTTFFFGGLIELIRMDEQRKVFLGKSLFEEKSIDKIVNEIVRLCTGGILRRQP